MDGVESDLVAELVELSDEAAGSSGLVEASDRVVAAEVVVGGVAAEHVPAGDEDAVGNRDQGAFVATSR
jgi:hypothetical protein